MPSSEVHANTHLLKRLDRISLDETPGCSLEGYTLQGQSKPDPPRIWTDSAVGVVTSQFPQLDWLSLRHADVNQYAMSFDQGELYKCSPVRQADGQRLARKGSSSIVCCYMLAGMTEQVVNCTDVLFCICHGPVRGSCAVISMLHM